MPKKRNPAEPELPAVLDLVHVGEIVGRARPGENKDPVAARTIVQYLAGSKPGGIYGDHPFPAPSGYLRRATATRDGGNPYWLPDRIPEIEEWARTRVGPGAGGGRPWHKTN